MHNGTLCSSDSVDVVLSVLAHPPRICCSILSGLYAVVRALKQGVLFNNIPDCRS